MSVWYLDRSGREHLSVAERQIWLRNDALLISNARNKMGSGSDVHALGELLEWMYSTPKQYSIAKMHYYLRRLSVIECDVMAWKRGGVVELKSTQEKRCQLDIDRTTLRRARVTYKYPFWLTSFTKENPWLDVGGEGG